MKISEKIKNQKIDFLHKSANVPSSRRGGSKKRSPPTADEDFLDTATPKLDRAAIYARSLISIGFIGAGNMAQAMIDAMIKSHFSANEIGVSDVDLGMLKKVKQKWKVTIFKTNAELIQNSNTIILAVKPFQLLEILQQNRLFFKKQTIISIAAGVETKDIHSFLSKDNKLIRCMPNQAAFVSESMTGLFSKNKFQTKEKKKLEKLFSSFGKWKWLKNEDQLDLITALCGSGPAYVYRIIQSFIKAAIKQGLDPESARELSIQTFLGASTLLKQSKENIELLISNVCSKKGTTLEGMKVLNKAPIDLLALKVIQAAQRRAEEIRKEFHQRENI